MSMRRSWKLRCVLEPRAQEAADRRRPAFRGRHDALMAPDTQERPPARTGGAVLWLETKN